MNMTWSERLPNSGYMRRALRIVTLALLVIVVARVEAAPIIQKTIQTNSFTQSPGNPLSFMSFDPFDSSLGNLNSVSLQFIGSLHGEIFTPPNIQGQDPVPLPTPYQYQMMVDHNLRGLTFDFEFANPARFIVEGTAHGAGGMVPVSLPFSYHMTFDSLSDLIGLSIPSTSGVTPPATVNSSREAFIADSLTESAGLMLASDLVPTVVSSSPSIQPFLGITAAAILTYDYTLVLDFPDDPVPVPVPGTLGLLITCVLSMFGMRRIKAWAKS